MTTTIHAVTNETQIRQIIDDWANTLRAKDIEGLMSHYTPDIQAIGLPDKDVYKSQEVRCCL